MEILFYFQVLIFLKRMTRIEKAWYKRIFNPVNYCQYRVHNLKHNDVPVSV